VSVDAPDRAESRPATLAALTGEVRRYLGRAFSGQARAGAAGLDARLIVAAAAGIAAERLPAVGDRPVDPTVAETAWILARRRADGEPTARLFGRKEFWSLDLALSPTVLVPRPDTETLVAAALDWVEAGGRRAAPLRLLDLGTGSGAILLALLSELPLAFGVGVDLDPAALVTARQNAAALGLAERSGFVASDWAAALGGRFDLIAANPPYVETAAIAALEPEVKDHDPVRALDGGADGLAAYRAIVPALRRLLRPDGPVLLEVGAGQAPAVAALLGEAGLETTSRTDLAGIERVVVGRSPAI